MVKSINGDVIVVPKTFRVLESFEKSLNYLVVPVAQSDRAPDS